MRCHLSALMLLAALVSPRLASSAVVFQHLDAGDPTTEGWSQQGPLAGAGTIVEGPVSNDSGFDAWEVDDDSTNNGSYLYFVQVPTDGEIADAAARGWTLRSRLRVVDVPDTGGSLLNASVGFAYEDGIGRYSVVLGSEADGDPVVTLITGQSTGTSFVLDGTGGGYHLYELVFDPGAGSADLFVDGVERISNYPGYTYQAGQKRVLFGGGSSPDTGDGRYNLVEFIIADPPPVALLSPQAQLLLATSLLTVSAWQLRRAGRREQPGGQGARAE